MFEYLFLFSGIGTYHQIVPSIFWGAKQGIFTLNPPFYRLKVNSGGAERSVPAESRDPRVKAIERFFALGLGFLDVTGDYNVFKHIRENLFHIFE